MRFELTDPRGSPVFKTGALDHSATLPQVLATARAEIVAALAWAAAKRLNEENFNFSLHAQATKQLSIYSVFARHAIITNYANGINQARHNRVPTISASYTGA